VYHALYRQYGAHISEVVQAAAWSSTADCGCISGEIPPDKCLGMADISASQATLKAGEAQRHADVDDHYVAGDGFPDLRHKVVFTNGAEMHILTNSALQAYPLFSLADVVSHTFGTELSSYTALFANEANSHCHFTRKQCQNTGLDPKLAAFHGFDPKGFAHMSYEDCQKKFSRANINSLRGMYDVLKGAGFKGQFVVTTNGAAKMQVQDLKSLLPTEAWNPDTAPFAVKALPLHREYVNDLCPFVFGEQFVGTCLCGNVNSLGLESVTKPWPVHTCPANCKNAAPDGSVDVYGHSCEPGLADITVNFLLHSLRVRSPDFGGM